MVNYSFEYTWIPAPWGLSNILLLKKDASSLLVWTTFVRLHFASVLVKAIQHARCKCLLALVNTRYVPNASQIGFRTSCSTWVPHKNFESRISLPLDYRIISCMVCINIKKAYDSVEHPILVLTWKIIPPSITVWMRAYLSDRSFFVQMINTRFKHNSDTFRQFRDVWLFKI